MEDEKQRLGTSRATAPPQQAPQIENPAKQKERATCTKTRKERPAEQASVQSAKRGPVDPPMNGGKIRVPAFCQPVSGEARHDPTCHHRDEHDHRGESEAPPEP
jgi:hypothetical protein